VAVCERNVGDFDIQLKRRFAKTGNYPTTLFTLSIATEFEQISRANLTITAELEITSKRQTLLANRTPHFLP